MDLARPHKPASGYVPPRTRLVDAARALFAEDGTRKTIVQAIAERAGIGRGSIAWHLGSSRAW
jgi:AcrR family transcriptional regulator